MKTLKSRKIKVTDKAWIEDYDGHPLAYVGSSGPLVNPEDSRRLVACWNMCDGVFTEDLEALIGMSPYALAHLLVCHSDTRDQKESFLQASDAIGSWLSAALEDPKVCPEMKNDINNWFEALEKLKP